ncbi:uncharacterized protein LOC120178975 [Hibiscus syriacus]|uniref:uncharacterized protein LOC120178975 n=1 Tax=Hibiscus syriacus TaxID=106335 RepID=UPI001920845A|nr:uncharacterized protein LOC120178975 [Hibiscus syriacus]
METNLVGFWSDGDEEFNYGGGEKAIKLDFLAFCSICIDALKAQSASNMDVGDGKSVVKLFRNGLTSVSAFKWLPHWSAETAVAFSTLHKLLMGPSSHCEADPSTTNELMESAFYSHLKGMLIDMKLEFQRLDPVIVACVDRLLGCDKHHWLGERLLQTMDENLHTRLIC